jgi:hypothetical protein
MKQELKVLLIATWNLVFSIIVLVTFTIGCYQLIQHNYDKANTYFILAVFGFLLEITPFKKEK